MRKLTRLGAAALCLMLAAGAARAGTLEDVKTRGVLRCGVAPSAPGFAAKDAQGTMRGFDIDLCRAIAAAIFGDDSKYEVTPLGLSRV